MASVMELAGATCDLHAGVAGASVTPVLELLPSPLLPPAPELPGPLSTPVPELLGPPATAVPELEWALCDISATVVTGIVRASSTIHGVGATTGGTRATCDGTGVARAACSDNSSRVARAACGNSSNGVDRTTCITHYRIGAACGNDSGGTSWAARGDNGNRVAGAA